MELRHLRYFIAVAEEGSLSVAASKRLHTAQPSLSRQMRDLELELGVKLMARSARGIELTSAGRVFLDHARIVLLQIEAAGEAARRAAEPAKMSFAVGFLTGYEVEWLPALMTILRDELPNTEVVIHSLYSPQLAAALLRGKLDLAFLRPEKDVSGLAYKALLKEPLIVLMSADHALAAQDTIDLHDIIGETLIGVPSTTAPVLRALIDRYGAEIGIDLKPRHEVDNQSMAISLVASTRGVCLLPITAKNFVPPSIVSRPIRGSPPMIDLVVGYRDSNTSPLLKVLLSKVEALKFQVAQRTD